MKTLVFPTVLAGLLASAPVFAHDMTAEEVKRLALEAILENPDIVMEAAALFREREEEERELAAAQAINDERQLLEQDPNAPVLGNPDGDVVVVEFFDYNCPYCKRAGDELAKVLETDPNIKIVYREWPILGEGSVFAARAALAARNQGKYAEMHGALMGMQGRAEENSVMAEAEKLGLDIEKLRADMDAPEVQQHIETTMRLSQALGFSGTPSFVIGNTRIPGIVDAEALKEVVAEARKSDG